jgi:hypothetical protein
MRISDAPDFCAACPLPEALLTELYHTREPTRADVEGDMAFLEEVERGQPG